MKNVLVPLTPVPSLFCDTAVSEGDDGIGEVLAACIHRYDRLEAADAVEAGKLAANPSTVPQAFLALGGAWIGARDR